MADVTYHVGDDTNAGSPVAGATVAACAKDDVSCATPLAQGTTDASGDATLTVPTGTAGFDGYAMLSKTGLLTTRWYQYPPITGAQLVTMTQFSPTNYAANLQGAGVTLDASKASVFTTVLDCNGASNTDVTVTLDGAPPDAYSTATGAFTMSPQVTQIFAAATPGQNAVAATLTAGAMSVATTMVTSGAGEVTFLVTPPTP